MSLFYVDGMLMNKETATELLGGMVCFAKEVASRRKGKTLHAKHFAFTPDKSKPSTWKLRLDDARHVAGAAAAVGKGFRGKKAQIPSEHLPKVKARIRRAWRKFNPGKSKDEMPEAIRK